MAIRDNRDYIRVLLYSYYATVTGWGVLLTYLCIEPEYRIPSIKEAQIFTRNPTTSSGMPSQGVLGSLSSARNFS